MMRKGVFCLVLLLAAASLVAASDKLKVTILVGLGAEIGTDLTVRGRFLALGDANVCRAAATGAGRKPCALPSIIALVKQCSSAARHPGAGQTCRRCRCRAPTARPLPPLPCLTAALAAGCSGLLQKKADNCDVVAEKGNEVEVHYLVRERLNQT
jgi:hypothetical protein